MPIRITDADGIDTIHVAERLEMQLLSAKEVVKRMKMKIWFQVETRLPSGKLIGQPYLDTQTLELSCEDNAELESVMTIIQQAIGQARYAQITAPPEIPEPVENPEMISPIENS